MSSAQPWPSEWLRGVLEVCVLRVLADGETYGYAIATRLADSGLGTVKGGTLYPLLIRLESAGLVTAQWRAGDGGPGRKYYELTDHGHAELAGTADAWVRFTALTGAIIADLPTPDADVTSRPTPRPAPRTTDTTEVAR
ncbi:PadR family transcriptional regulator [Pengzhenrongella frigida]|uniref:PadR family transcriptional regulator n=1 Tax=Pengzhenrongella frigida TaxID=1259133 RepID=A0A4Q5N0A9_9MICO|nr:PadR family transcriptional regulator [Cellulomonas sp. HLT2-17]RYV49917.1 PadR family transcriptional regulator [Cellulomonas sp. HLT2-17]